MPSIGEAFLITTRKRLERILEEFPRIGDLDRVIVRGVKDLRDAFVRTLAGEIAIVFPFPLRPTLDAKELSKQVAFLLASPRRIFVSLYPRPEIAIRLAKDPLVLGDLLISPGSLWRLIEK